MWEEKASDFLLFECKIQIKRGSKIICLLKKVDRQTLLRGGRDSETASSQWSHRLAFVRPAVGTARRLSVWSSALFLQSSGIFQAVLISPDKGMELFSLSHQQLGLSTIRPIGPKLLSYCKLTEANTGNRALLVCFVWFPQRRHTTRLLLALTVGDVQNKNICLQCYPSFTGFL